MTEYNKADLLFAAICAIIGSMPGMAVGIAVDHRDQRESCSRVCGVSQVKLCGLADGRRAALCEDGRLEVVR